jgi:hypothetical protein
MRTMGKVARALFGLSPDEVTFSRRGFTARSQSTQLRLERVGSAFVAGYHAQLRDRALEKLDEALTLLPADDRGFAVEGAAMAATLLDSLWPWRRERFAQLLARFQKHVYMIHVGAGWAWARLRVDPTAPMARLDPLLRWLAIDGYGFHEGYFHWPEYADGTLPRRLRGYQLRAFDQGLGRSLWFVLGGDAVRVSGAINTLLSARHDDLWSGVGLAATYAGGVDAPVLMRLRELCGPHRPALAQGAAFAAKARLHSGIVPLHVEAACQILAAHSASEAARWTDSALASCKDNGELPAFAVWRAGIRALFSEAVHDAAVPSSTSP